VIYGTIHPQLVKTYLLWVDLSYIPKSEAAAFVLIKRMKQGVSTMHGRGAPSRRFNCHTVLLTLRLGRGLPLKGSFFFFLYPQKKTHFISPADERAIILPAGGYCSHDEFNHSNLPGLNLRHLASAWTPISSTR
jgi:hypothetical protein